LTASGRSNQKIKRRENGKVRYMTATGGIALQIITLRKNRLEKATRGSRKTRREQKHPSQTVPFTTGVNKACNERKKKT